MSNLTLKLETIQFHNQSLIVLNKNNKSYVAMKPICENIGLDWAAQFKRIQRHHVLSKGVVMITTPSKGGIQEYVCLPISMINGWLFGINTNRVKTEIRQTLEQYQLECFDVLYKHFMLKASKKSPNKVTLKQQNGTLLDDYQLYAVYFLLNHFNHLHRIFNKYDLYKHLTGLGSKAGIEMIDHFKDASTVNFKLAALSNEFDAVQQRLGLNQYSK